MYTKFYGLLERPFELMPDPRYLYLSDQHREALAHLAYGVSERKDLIQLTGEVGTGKTLMLDALVCDLDASTKVAKLSYTTIDALDLHRMLAGEFGIDAASETKAGILALLTERLAEWSAEGRSAVFIVDEAQNLRPSVLEEIRLLSNLRSNGCLSLQIILAGQPELREKLNATELRQLRQRIGIRYHLKPLSEPETGEYIAHRLTVAGATERIFEPGTTSVVFEYSDGVPRLINMLCDRALLAGYAENCRQITPALVRKAIAGVEGAGGELEEAAVVIGRPPSADETPRSCRWVVPAVAALAVVLVAAGGYLASHGRPREESASGAAASIEAPVIQAPPADGDDGQVGLTGSEGAADVPVAEEADAPHPIVLADDVTEMTTGSYAVAAMSSPSEREAGGEAERLAGGGIWATVTAVELEGRGTWYRVVLDGGYKTPDDASATLALLREIGYPDPWVTRR